MEKYVSKKSDGIANCPYCRGVIFRNFKVNKGDCKISFLMRCPHCQKEVAVIIDKGEIVIEPHDGSKEKA